MRSVILGTAGHVDHGKTALVRALTGVDTDRLKEEKARGITIELGFAELHTKEGTRVGVVDVPGHEAFVRNMVAGATGMDVVLLVVAADEGVMPQTREHVAIVELLGVERMVVAITKSDLVDPEWLELVEADVEELLGPTPFAGAPMVVTSAPTGAGLERLSERIVAAAERGRAGDPNDLARLPVDRAFTVRGTGTVVTGTLWSGTLSVRDRVRLHPGGVDARIRGLEVHGAPQGRAEPGSRTAVALTGPSIERGAVDRGMTLVSGPGWRETWMLTCEVRLLPGAPAALIHNQRVRVHLGTAEILARCALLQGHPIAAGETGWVQLRLESPTVARARDRLVLRSYSPLTTLGGGLVAEPCPPKRRGLDADLRSQLARVASGEPQQAVVAVLSLAGWAGVPEPELPTRTGLSERTVGRVLEGDPGLLRAAGSAFGGAIVRDAERRMLAALTAGHEAHPLRSAVSRDSLRAAVPGWAHPDLADGSLVRLAARGALELVAGGARSPGHVPSQSPEQAHALRKLRRVFSDAGLTPPRPESLPAELAQREDVWELLRHLEGEGILTTLPDGTLIDREALRDAETRVRIELAGQQGLGPADFRAVLPLPRKHLMPLLAHLDRSGVTVRLGRHRTVPDSKRPKDNQNSKKSVSSE